VDMKHMEFLQAVADGDVETLRRKETTYMGSWKVAGGRSAWFMFRRNMDRLMTMMKPPSTPHGFSMADLDDLLSSTPDAHGDVTLDVSILSYLRDCYVAQDIFAQIELDPSGADGTVLACLQDLRRYATLIEAEMMARGVIAVRRTPESSYLWERGNSGGGQGGNAEWPVTGGGDRAATMEYPGQGGAGEPRARNSGPGTPEDGGHHDGLVEYLAPWVVDRDIVGGEIYKQNALNVHVLEQFVSTVPLGISTFYIPFGGGYVLNMRLCPTEVRSYFPSLPMEQNATELSSRPQWQCGMYDEQETKHILRPEFHAWHIDSSEIE
jgi:hypothetical protein